MLVCSVVIIANVPEIGLELWTVRTVLGNPNGFLVVLCDQLSQRQKRFCLDLFLEDRNDEYKNNTVVV